MTFKTLLLTGAGMAVVGMAGATVHFLREASAEAEATQERLKPESDCATQVNHAVELVARRDNAAGATNRVIESASHYNQVRHRCYVEITTYEHKENPVYVKTLVSVGDDAAVLWSITGRVESPGRTCFGADSMSLNCEAADKRWKSFMTQ